MLLYVSHTVIRKQKPINKRLIKHVTKGNHQIIREETKRRNEQRNYKTYRHKLINKRAICTYLLLMTACVNELIKVPNQKSRGMDKKITNCMFLKDAWD